MPDELSRALRIVWIIIGFVSGFLVIAPLVFPAGALFGVVPVCAAKAAGGSCFLCGMTTSFVRIGGGDFAGAQASNSGSVALYAVLGLNFVAALSYTMLRVIRHANT